MLKIGLENTLFITGPEWVYDRTKHLRDRGTQAVLPITDGIIKSNTKRIDKVLDCVESKAIVSALGIGIDLGDPACPVQLRMENLRYGTIVLLFENTESGNYTRDQIVALMKRFMNKLIDNGHVFQPVEEVREDMTNEEFAEKFMQRETRKLGVIN